MIALERIQAQLRESARSSYDAVPVPPFTCFFNADDPSPWANYAIPDKPIDGDVDRALTDLASAFDKQGRTPRFEFLDAFAPGLADTLTAHGYVNEGNTFLMICEAATYRPAPLVADLTIIELLQESSLVQIQRFLTVQRRAFGNDDTYEADEEEAAQFQVRFAGTRLFSAQVHGQIVGVGSLTPPSDRIAEAAGIATLTEFRRRGIGAAVTAAIARAAFARGLDAVFLTARDAAAGRLYARVGFQAAGSARAFYLPTDTRC